MVDVFFNSVVSVDVLYLQYISHVPSVKNNSVKRLMQTMLRIIQNNILYERSSMSYKTCFLDTSEDMFVLNLLFLKVDKLRNSQ